jgi:hypothetical protein
MGSSLGKSQQTSTPINEVHKSNVVRDVSSNKDWVFDTFVGVISTNISLRSNMPPVYECPANRSIACAIASLIAYDSENLMSPSIDFLHYNARLDKNGVLSSSKKMNIRSGFKALKCYGVCHADTFPNNEFYDDIAPCDTCYNEAEVYKSFEYYRVYDNEISEVRKCIAMGFPVIFALELFEYSGVGNGDNFVLTHSPKNEAPIGSFAFIAVGYDDISCLIEFRNFRGECWGDSGYGFIHYEYMKKHSHSMWVLRSEYVE